MFFRLVFKASRNKISFSQFLILLTLGGTLDAIFIQKTSLLIFLSTFVNLFGAREYTIIECTLDYKFVLNQKYHHDSFK